MTGELKYPGRPFIFHKTPWAIRRPAPLLGQHNSEVYSQLGFAREEIGKMREAGII